MGHQVGTEMTTVQDACVRFVRLVLSGNRTELFRQVGLSLEGQERMVEAVTAAGFANPAHVSEDLRRQLRIIACLLPDDETLLDSLHALIDNSRFEHEHVAYLLADHEHEVPMGTLRAVVQALVKGETVATVCRQTGTARSTVEKVGRFFGTRSAENDRCSGIAYSYALAEYNFQAWRRHLNLTDDGQARAAWAMFLLSRHTCLSDEEQAVGANVVTRTLQQVLGRSRAGTRSLLLSAMRDVEQVEGVLA